MAKLGTGMEFREPGGGAKPGPGLTWVWAGYRAGSCTSFPPGEGDGTRQVHSGARQGAAGTAPQQNPNRTGRNSAKRPALLKGEYARHH